jgi:hypothetical protein
MPVRNSDDSVGKNPTSLHILRHHDGRPVVGVVRCVELATKRTRLDSASELLADGSNRRCPTRRLDDIVKAGGLGHRNIPSSSLSPR